MWIHGWGDACFAPCLGMTVKVQQLVQGRARAGMQVSSPPPEGGPDEVLCIHLAICCSLRCGGLGRGAGRLITPSPGLSAMDRVCMLCLLARGKAGGGVWVCGRAGVCFCGAPASPLQIRIQTHGTTADLDAS